jgi:hypothetical protein
MSGSNFGKLRQAPATLLRPIFGSPVLCRRKPRFVKRQTVEIATRGRSSSSAGDYLNPHARIKDTRARMIERNGANYVILSSRFRRFGFSSQLQIRFLTHLRSPSHLLHPNHCRSLNRFPIWSMCHFWCYPWNLCLCCPCLWTQLWRNCFLG